jgi:hypothetical protein
MAVKSSVQVSDELNAQDGYDFEEMLKIIDLKYSGIVASDSRILKQEEGEKLDDFIERLKRLN